MSELPEHDLCDPDARRVIKSPSGKAKVSLCGDCGFAVAYAKGEIVTWADLPPDAPATDQRSIDFLRRAVAGSTGGAKDDFQDVLNAVLRQVDDEARADALRGAA